MKINLLTVAKVYQLLEGEGLVETRRGLGTFVLGGRPAKPAAERRKLIAEAVAQVVAEACGLGLEEEEVIKLIRQRFEETKNKS